MSLFNIDTNCKQGYARIAYLNTQHGKLQTPHLLPVINFIGGTTPHCGGMWKYTRQQVFHTHIPVMSEIMHFLDYHLSAQGLAKWRQKTFHEWFPEFDQPLFLDSGGFQLLTNQGFDLSGLDLTASPKDILNLQLDFGADMIATLDYPLPPNLNKRETQERVKLSIENAIATLRLLQQEINKKTLVFVPIHGRTPEEIEMYIRKFVTRYRRSGLERQFDGFAVGSLVPLRNDPVRVVQLLLKVKRVLQDMSLENLPLHVFGVGSDLIPFLVYLGFDTFDSSSYAQNAQRLRYADPETWASHRATQLQELKCQCSACKQIDLNEMRDVLTSEVSFRQINGHFKSEFYALVAIHNLNLYLDELKVSVAAARNGLLEDHLLKFTHKRPRTRLVVEYLAEEFSGLKVKTTRSIHAVARPQSKNQQRLSLRYKPSDFSIPKTYQIPRHQRILFLFPCSKEKPYSQSQTYKRITDAVRRHLNTTHNIHYVVVSGLYGPVPLQYDNLPQTKNYDFVLTFMNRSGINLVGDRIADYLKKYGNHFDHIVAFAIAKPYRQAIQRGIQGHENAHLFPTGDRTGKIGRSVLYWHGLKQCMEFLKNGKFRKKP